MVLSAGFLVCRAARGPDFGQGFAPHPTPFLCLAKEKGEKKGNPGRAPYACGSGSPALLENRGRPELAPATPSLRTCGADFPPVFCDARHALREVNRLGVFSL